jgi:hypothetical protein
VNTPSQDTCTGEHKGGVAVEEAIGILRASKHAENKKIKPGVAHYNGGETRRSERLNIHGAKAVSMGTYIDGCDLVLPHMRGRIGCSVRGLELIRRQLG